VTSETVARQIRAVLGMVPLTVTVLALLTAVPAFAQEDAPVPAESSGAGAAEESTAAVAQAAPSAGLLFDRFSFKISARFATLDTTIRVDDKNRLLPGTEIDLESDLGLGDSEIFGEFKFQWLIARRHRVSFLYDRNDRSGFQTIAKEIRFEDIVFPLNAEIDSRFESRNIGIGYTYFFKRGERTAIGANLVLVMGEFKSTLTGIGRENLEDIEITAEADTQVPQPQLGLEWRQMIGQRWRLIAAASGVALNLDVGTDGQFDGSLLRANVSIEHLTFKYASFGAGFGASLIDATFEDEDDLQQVKSNSLGAELFIRIRTP